MGYFLFIVIGAASSQLQVLGESVSVQDNWILPLWSGSAFQKTVLSILPPPSVLFQAIIGNEGELVIPALLGIAQGIGGLIAAIAIILILSIYWGIDQVHFERLWLSLMPSDQRKSVRSIWRIIEPEIGSYIRGQFIHSLLIGLVLCLGYWLLGSPYSVILALIGALFCLIPVVGAALAIIPPLLVGMMISVQHSLFMALFTIVILVSFIILVKPRLVNRRWENPILTVIFLIALADAFGIFGILIAPPLSIICQILWSSLVSHPVEASTGTQITDLKERLATLRETINIMEGPHLPLVTSSVERIASLIDSAEPLINAATPAGTPDSEVKERNTGVPE